MTSYGNVLVATADAVAVAGIVGQQGRGQAWVAPPVEGWTTLFDPDLDRGREAVILPLIEALSGRLRTTAWAVTCVDDDVLLYWLARQGRVIDRYESWPAYFDERAGDRPRGGDAERLAEAIGAGPASRAPASRAPVLRALTAALAAGNGDSGPYPFAVERHEAIVEALSLPSRYAYCGWRAVTAADAEAEIPARARFLRAGRP
jgi:hypothetical protein